MSSIHGYWICICKRTYINLVKLYLLFVDSFYIKESRIQTKMHCCKSPGLHLRVLPTILGSQSEKKEAWDDEAENKGDKGIWSLSTCRCPPTEIIKQ